MVYRKPIDRLFTIERIREEDWLTPHLRRSVSYIISVALNLNPTAHAASFMILISRGVLHMVTIAKSQ